MDIKTKLKVSIEKLDKLIIYLQKNEFPLQDVFYCLLFSFVPSFAKLLNELLCEIK